MVKRARRQVEATQLNMTAMIDVVFQLLIFFLLTATFNNDAAFKVKLPTASASEPARYTVGMARPRSRAITLASTAGR